MNDVLLHPGGPEQLTTHLPPPLVIDGALGHLRSAAAERGSTTVVLDDDPTGTQTLHDVSVGTGWSEQAVADLLDDPPLSVLLTNTRSMGPSAARDVVAEIAERVHSAARRRGVPVRLVSRGDSTLRGHVPLETDVLAEVGARHGQAPDGLVITPAYLEAGRVTVDGVHYARTGSGWTPVGESEYARDATFGYRSSDLRQWVEEKSGGRWPAHRVRLLDLATLRGGGVDAAAAVLEQLQDGDPVVVDAAADADLEVLALAVDAVERSGRRLLHRCGPSLVRVMAGLEKRPPLRGRDLYPGGAREGNGLVVVGSHTATTSRQVQGLEGRGMRTVEIDVTRLDGTASVPRHVDEVVAALADGDVVLQTSRTSVRGTDGEDSLRIAARASQALTAVVLGVRTRAPLRWVVAKGGITSHDIAVHALGIRRARVTGQIFDGLVSVWTTEDADVGTGLPYLVFAGNVGADDSLALTVDALRGTTR